MRLRGALLGAGNIALRGARAATGPTTALRREPRSSPSPTSPVEPRGSSALLPEATTYDGGGAAGPGAARFLRHLHASFHAPRPGGGGSGEVPRPLRETLAPTIIEAERMAAAIRRAGIVFQPCHQYHYSPQWQAVKALSPRLGRVTWPRGSPAHGGQHGQRPLEPGRPGAPMPQAGRGGSSSTTARTSSTSSAPSSASPRPSRPPFAPSSTTPTAWRTRPSWSSTSGGAWPG